MRCGSRARKRLSFALNPALTAFQPSHGDKAANPEVLRWVNELSKLRKDLKGELLLSCRANVTTASVYICCKANGAQQNTS